MEDVTSSIDSTQGNRQPPWNQEKYEKLCEDEVRELTGIQFNKGPLDFEFQGAGWSYERLFQVLFVHNTRFDEFCHGAAVRLLVELHREDPTRLFHRIHTTYKICRIPDKGPYGNWPRELEQQELEELRRDLPGLLASAFDLEFHQFRLFLWSFWPVEEENRAATRSMIMETAILMLERRDKSDAFEMFITSKAHFGYPGPPSIPFVTGIRVILDKQYRKFEIKLEDYIRSWAKDKCLDDTATRKAQKPLFGIKPFQFGFAPSGSGKTTSIFAELTRRYGYYMVSCALARYGGASATCSSISSPKQSIQTIMDPKVLRGVSADTRELASMLGFVESLDVPQFWARPAQTWWSCIIETRHRIFRCFKRTLAETSNPSLWLSFQLDKFTWDPFLQAFRVLALFPGPGWAVTNPDDGILKSSMRFDSIDIKPPTEYDEKAYWACIDEAQEDLGFTSPIERSNLLSAAMGAFGQNAPLVYMTDFPAVEDTSKFVYFSKAIFAGTSLNAWKALETLRTLRNEKNDRVPQGWGKPQGVWRDDGSEVVAKYHLVINKDAAQDVLQSYGLTGSVEAVEHSESLWGRVKWTALYAERIIKEIDTEGRRDFGEVQRLFAEKKATVNFQKLAEETYMTIMENLCLRLRKLSDGGDCGQLLDNLLEAAISADVLDRPHVWYQESDMQLVEEGFAIVESRIDRLEEELTRNKEFTIVARSEGYLTARLVDGCNVDIDGAISKLLSVIQKDGFAIADCKMNQLDSELLHIGITIMDCSMDNLITELREHGFEAERKSQTQVVARLPAEVPKTGAIANARKKWLGGFLDRDSGANEGKKKARQADNRFKRATDWTGPGDSKLTIECNYSDSKLKKQLKHIFSSPRFDTDERACYFTAKLRDGSKITKEEKNRVEDWVRGGHFKVVNKPIGKLVNFLKKPFFIIDCPADHITADLAEDGFTIWGSHKKVNLLANLQTIVGLKVVETSHNSLHASLSPGEDVDKNQVCESLKQRLGGEFVVRSEKQNSLAAKLAERVVIDAVIKFSMNRRLDEKIMTYVRLATHRSGIGHILENYLAVRFRQYLSKLPEQSQSRPSGQVDESGISQAKMRRRILKILAKADNHKHEKIEQKTGSLEGFHLIIGKQTVKKFENHLDFLPKFLEWLQDIEDGRKPRMGFMIPHNHFGPDLVFALRSEDKSRILLCSVQLKSGEGNEDAVNKSSISWACGGRQARMRDHTTANKTRLAGRRKQLEQQRQKLEVEQEMIEAKRAALGELYEIVLKRTNMELKRIRKELSDEGDKPETEGSSQPTGMGDLEEMLDNTFWRDQSRLSLLISVGSPKQEQLTRTDVRPYTSHREERETNELFAHIDEEDTEDLFGRGIAEMMTVL